MTKVATSVRTWTELKPPRKAVIPEGLWLRCPGCSGMQYRKQLDANLSVCPDCQRKAKKKN